MSRMAPSHILQVICIAAILTACSTVPEKDHRLEEVLPENSGILFRNDLTFTPDFNIVEYLYFYNGGGVAIGDINNDGLEDLYFSSNQESNRLYLNLGDFRFRDITDSAGVAAEGNWKTGVNMADINQDGWLDIFSCGVGGYKKFNGQNQVFLNNKDNTFTESAQELGLAFTGLSTHTAFFDADQDGDLDLYLLNHSVHNVRSMGNVDLRHMDDPKAGDRLYENRLVPDGITKFVPMPAPTGLLSSALGYGLGLAVSDINSDDLPDLYVSNDFHENDYLYLNAGKGKFKNTTTESLTHTSRFSMGSTSADLNNDGRPDLLTLDMLPPEEHILKASAGEDPYDIFQYKLKLGFHIQYARNAFQLNMGNTAEGTPILRDIAPYAGIEATDWSWSPLAADIDNDGWKDLYITNGIHNRPNDLDYISYISNDSAQRFFQYEDFLRLMPPGGASNAIFSNNGDLTFTRQTGKWDKGVPNFSNGAAYADLDLDGDLDIVVNRINESPMLLKNTTDSLKGVVIELQGTVPNRSGYGAKLEGFVNGKMQFQEHQPSRGFQSSVSQRIHFATLNKGKLDSLRIKWPDGTLQVVRDIPAGKPYSIRKDDTGYYLEKKNISPLFESVGAGPSHTENEYSAFNHERLLPHAFDAPGPRLCAADLDGDGADDLFIGGNSIHPTRILWGNTYGVSSETILDVRNILHKDVSACIFLKINKDEKYDLLVLFGGQETDNLDRNSKARSGLQPQIWLNRGNRKFEISEEAFASPISIHGSCIAAADVDGDGDEDVFAGSNLVPDRYGETPASHLLINDGHGRLNSANDRLPAMEGRIGMVSDAVFTDLDGNGFPDLILAGMWMPIRVLLNDGKRFRDATSEYELSGTEGWWHRIAVGDFDGDGDADLIAGNDGLNHRLSATPESPLGMVVADLDGNGSLDQLLEYGNQGGRWPFVSKDQLIKQVPSLRKSYLRYSQFSNSTVPEIIKKSGFDGKTPELKANMLQSVFAENKNGKFVLHPLPAQAQFSSVFAICPADINGDKFTDFILGGNHYQVMPEIGRQSASTGTVLIGKGNGTFEAKDGIASGLYLPGQCRDLVRLNSKGTDGKWIVAAGMNNAPLLRFKPVFK